MTFLRRSAQALGLGAALLLGSQAAQAVPSFSRQTGSECVACHVGGVGAQLTAYGIKFKLTGYTDTDGKGGKVPLSLRLRFTSSNPNLGDSATRMDQAAIMLAGRLTEGVGAMASLQRDVDGVTLKRTTSLIKTDIKYATEKKFGDTEAVLGASLNNSPGVQDPVGTLPATGWGVASNESRAFGQEFAHTLLSGRLANRSVGITGFGMLDNQWYAELGNYSALSPSTADNLLGQDPVNDPGRVRGFAPYWRAFYMRDFKSQFFTAGLVGMNADIETIRGAPTDRLRDIGVDVSYGYIGNREHQFKFRGAYIREKRTYGTSFPGALQQGNVTETTVSGTYLYRNTYGLMWGQSRTRGSTDNARFFPNGQPGARMSFTTAFITPFGKEDSWGAPWANMRLGIARIKFTQFNGGSSDLFGNRFNSFIPLLSAHDIGLNFVYAEFQL